MEKIKETMKTNKIQIPILCELKFHTNINKYNKRNCCKCNSWEDFILKIAEVEE